MCFELPSRPGKTEQIHFCSHPTTWLWYHLGGKSPASTTRSIDGGRLASMGYWCDGHLDSDLVDFVHYLFDWAQFLPLPCRCRHQVPFGPPCSPLKQPKCSVLLSLSIARGGIAQCQYLSIYFRCLASRAWPDTPAAIGGRARCEPPSLCPLDISQTWAPSLQVHSMCRNVCHSDHHQLPLLCLRCQALPPWTTKWKVHPQEWSHPQRILPRLCWSPGASSDGGGDAIDGGHCHTHQFLARSACSCRDLTFEGLPCYCSGALLNHFSDPCRFVVECRLPRRDLEHIISQHWL